MIQFSILDRSLIFTRRHLCEISNIRQERGGWCIGKLKSGIHIRGEADEFHFRWHVEKPAECRQREKCHRQERGSFVLLVTPSNSFMRTMSHHHSPFFCSWIINSFSTMVLLRIFLPQLFVWSLCCLFPTIIIFIKTGEENCTPYSSISLIYLWYSHRYFCLVLYLSWKFLRYLVFCKFSLWFNDDRFWTIMYCYSKFVYI